jgi:hypothetical protein
LGKQKWVEFKEKSKLSKENFISRYGTELGEKKYNLFCKRSANTKENFIRVHGYEEGLTRWKKYKNSNAGYIASKESLAFFKHLTDFSLAHGIDFSDIFYGVENSCEYKIEEGTKLHSFDYTILPLKLIFEYNGSHVHPSKEKLTTEQWERWRCPWTGKSADEKFELDRLKLASAEKKGFTVIEIWDYETKENIEQMVEKCVNLIKERI